MAPTRKWQMAGSIGILGYLTWGLGYFALPVFYGPLQQEFGWTHVAVAWLGTLTILTYSVVGPAIGFFVDRAGVRIVLLGGLICVGVSMAVFPLVGGTTWGLNVVGVLNGIACAAVSIISSQVTVNRWFPEHATKAIAVILVIMGLGGISNSILAGEMIARFGWRTAAFALDALTWVLGLGCVAVFRDAPSQREPMLNGARNPLAELFSTLADRQFHTLAAGVFLAMGAGNGILQNLALQTKHLGYDVRFGGFAVATFLAANLLARVIISMLSERAALGIMAASAFALMAVGALILAFATPLVWVVMGIVLAGLGYGGGIVTISATAGEVFKSRSLGGVMGFVVLSSGAGSSFGTVLAARIADLTGSYRFAFVTFAGFLLGACFLIPPLALTNLRRLPGTAESPIRP